MYWRIVWNPTLVCTYSSSPRCQTNMNLAPATEQTLPTILLQHQHIFYVDTFNLCWQPLQDLRPRFDISMPFDEIQASVNADKRTPTEKLNQVKTALDRFIFFKYYDGFSTDGRIGFSPRSGPPGSVNHKRAHATLTDLTPSQFRVKGKTWEILRKNSWNSKLCLLQIFALSFSPECLLVWFAEPPRQATTTKCCPHVQQEIS